MGGWRELLSVCVMCMLMVVCVIILVVIGSVWRLVVGCWVGFLSGVSFSCCFVNMVCIVVMLLCIGWSVVLVVVNGGGSFVLVW